MPKLTAVCRLQIVVGSRFSTKVEINFVTDYYYTATLLHYSDYYRYYTTQLTTATTLHRLTSLLHNTDYHRYYTTLLTTATTLHSLIITSTTLH